MHMLLAHIVIGSFPIQNNSFSWFWFLGSVIPDADHIMVIAKNRFFTLRKIVDSIRFEHRYGVQYKTKYFHSLLGAVVICVPLLFVSSTGAIYFFLGYFVHLLVDWLDVDEKQFLYPLKIKFRGFLPIFSKTEMIVTIILTISLFVFYN